MKKIYDECLVEASGNYLSERFPEAILHFEVEMLDFIAEHKQKNVEYSDDEDVLNLIKDLANTLDRFVTRQLSKLINEKFPIEVIAALSNGASEDIWYDATAYDDVGMADVISHTQSAMQSTSATLQELIMQNR